MLAGFVLALIGALLKLRPRDFVDSFGCCCCFGLVVLGFVGWLVLVVVVLVPCFMLLWFSLQRSNLGSSAASMRLRPKRTCSGVVCLGGFHIKRFISLFLFLRGGLT